MSYDLRRSHRKLEGLSDKAFGASTATKSWHNVPDEIRRLGSRVRGKRLRYCARPDQ
jgi:hypothetical protein